MRLLIPILLAHAALFFGDAAPANPQAAKAANQQPPKPGKPQPPRRNNNNNKGRKGPPQNRGNANKKSIVYKKNSFEPPFENFNSKGERKIDGWVVGGDASIEKNYIRVANDRASKKGWIYNTAPTSNKKWTLEMKFRISGQGQRLYGDGLALWLTSTARSDYQRGGSLFGAPNKINGFGILFDTYKNAETGNLHKDIMLLANDGTKEAEMHKVIPTGCNSNYRMWEQRDDFSATQFSIAVVEFDAQQRKLNVRIDEDGSGRMRDCFEYVFPTEGADALGDLGRMHLAISSSTGQLADNHDVLSVQLSEFGDKEAGQVDDEVDPDKLGLRVSPDVMRYVKAQMALLEAKLTEMDHDVEHKLDGIGDTLTATTDALKKSEAEDRVRIEALEKRIVTKIEGTLEEAMDELVGDMVEEIMDTKLEEHGDDLKDMVMEHVEESQTDLIKEITGDVLNSALMEGVASNSGWMLPFFVLTIAMSTVTYVAWTKWRKLMKSHLP